MEIIQAKWLYIGQACFGLLIGFFVGLSISPIVSSVVGLLFAFIGGSILLLIKGKSSEELLVIGKSISALSLLMIIGVIIGISFRVNDVLIFVDDNRSPFTLSKPLTVSEIIRLSTTLKLDEDVICVLVKSSYSGDKPTKLSADEQKQLEVNEVPKKVLLAMFSSEFSCLKSAAPSSEQMRQVRENGTHLLGEEIEKKSSSTEKKHTPMPHPSTVESLKE